MVLTNFYPAADSQPDTIRPDRVRGNLRSPVWLPLPSTIVFRAVNAYLRWLGSPLKLGKLKEPQRVYALYSEDDIKLIARWKPQEPRKSAPTRAQVLALTLADTGCRSSELLTLKWAQVDFDNLLLTVAGKGDKERVIPFSYELRRYLYQWKQKVKHDLVFGTQQGMVVSITNAHHALGHMLDDLGIKHPRRLVHCFRHSFATFYLKRGGSSPPSATSPWAYHPLCSRKIAESPSNLPTCKPCISR